MDKLNLLKSLKLFSRVPREQLLQLEGFLQPLTLSDGEAVFHEGSPGDSLYFIAEGRVRIAKLLPRENAAPGEAPLYKDLSILAPGDCFGEMALIESVTRSADALAAGPTTLLRLGREDLDRWLTANPALALGFFAQLVQVISGRLRRSSEELAMLFDLSQILLEQFASPKDLLGRVLERITPHMDGAWSAGAYAYNEFNDERELAATHDDFASIPEAHKAAAAEGRTGWLDDQTFVVSFPGPRHDLGCFLFRCADPLSPEERTEFYRALSTTARLISTAIENLSFRAEEGFRSRLNKVKTTEF